MEKQKLPHSQNALIFGIISIVTACCCNGIIGVIFSIIGLNNAKKAKAINDENPELYNGIKNAETGRITSTIGLVIGIIFSLIFIYMIASGKWGETMEQYKEMIEQMQ